MNLKWIYIEFTSYLQLFTVIARTFFCFFPIISAWSYGAAMASEPYHGTVRGKSIARLDAPCIHQCTAESRCVCCRLCKCLCALYSCHTIYHLFDVVCRHMLALCQLPLEFFFGALSHLSCHHSTTIPISHQVGGFWKRQVEKWHPSENLPKIMLLKQSQKHWHFEHPGLCWLFHDHSHIQSEMQQYLQPLDLGTSPPARHTQQAEPEIPPKTSVNISPNCLNRQPHYITDSRPSTTSHMSTHSRNYLKTFSKKTHPIQQYVPTPCQLWNCTLHDSVCHTHRKSPLVPTHIVSPAKMEAWRKEHE